MIRCLVFMFSHDWKFREIDGKVTKICFLMRRETSSLRVITYFDSFAYRIWFGSWIRLNVRDGCEPTPPLTPKQSTYNKSGLILSWGGGVGRCTDAQKANHLLQK